MLATGCGYQARHLKSCYPAPTVSVPSNMVNVWTQLENLSGEGAHLLSQAQILNLVDIANYSLYDLLYQTEQFKTIFSKIMDHSDNVIPIIDLKVHFDTLLYMENGASY